MNPYRDLIWVAESSSLIRHEKTFPGISEHQLRKLHEGEYSNAFTSFLAPREIPRQVGRYFELLVEFLLVEVLEVTLLERNRQVFVEDQTVGEVDFIFSTGDRIVHLETAVKFYLELPTPHSSGSFLVGPNSNDFFEAKMSRLFEHQLPLSHQHFPEVTDRTAWVKGRIFRHWKNRPEIPTPTEMNSNCERGIWCYSSEWLEACEEIPADVFAVHSKPHWLADLSLRDEPEQFVSSEVLQDQIKSHFAGQDRPLMLTGHVAENGEADAVRIFVMNDQWP